MNKKNSMAIGILVLVVAITSLFSGCGGGGGGTASAPGAAVQPSQQTPQNTTGASGVGKIAAVVKLTGKVAGRPAAQTSDATVNVTITITGIYSGDGSEFSPVSTTYPVNLSQGYARVSLVEVPVGINHLLTAKADWGGGLVETVMVIIPKVETGQTSTVTANEETTVVAATAQHYAQEHNLKLTDIEQEMLDNLAEAVADMAKNTPYSSMTPSSVMGFMANMGVPLTMSISPASATIALGETLQFTALTLDGNGNAVTGASATWSFSPASYASVASTGLLSTLLAGSGTLTATYQQLTAMALVTIVDTCSADTECNDGQPLTLDVCSNPGALTSSCSHTTIACMTVSDCNDGNALTLDECTSGGTVSAACVNTPIACNDGLDCDDGIALTLDVCANGGTSSAACSNTPYACNIDTDCNDNDLGTIDTCTAGGTLLAACSNPAAVCGTDADCNDNNALTTDTCSYPGTTSASCSSVYRKTISSGVDHTCEIQPDTTVKCWGSNFSGQIGMGQFAGGQLAKRVAVRPGERTAAKPAGQGSKAAPRHTSRKNRSTARTANAMVGNLYMRFTTPTSVLNLTGAVQVSSGGQYSCAVINDGTVQCWGAGGVGQLGDGLLVDSAVPVAVSGITNAVAVSAGFSHACALLADGSAVCWGENTYGGLGDGTTTMSPTPIPVTGLSGTPVQISAGYYTTCALISDGTAQCWGINYYGNLGDGTTTDSLVPVTVNGLTGAVLIDVDTGGAGGLTVCAIVAGGAVQCWGANMFGQLGDGTNADAYAPVFATGITGAVDIEAGASTSCAALATGEAYCWGSNDMWKLGNSSVTQSNTPMQTSALTGLVNSVTVGNSFTCFSLTGGTFKCFGDYYDGQLGDGRSSYNETPMSEFDLTGILGKPSIGIYHACTAMTDGTIRCWGYNWDGQLGADPANASLAIYPVTVSGISTAQKTTAGSYHSCALLADTTALCWGYNFSGQLGDGTNTDSFTPVPVTDGLGGTLTGIADIVAGDEFTCASMLDGTAKCWGYGFSGQLGDDMGTDSNIPVDVLGLTGVIDISAGSEHVCAIADSIGGMARTAGRSANVPGVKTVYCWGYNLDGELGNGGTMTEYMPFDNGLLGATKISAGAYHTCALMADGTMQCWGTNYDGRLGIGTNTTYELSPVVVSGVANAIDITAGANTTCAAISDGTVMCWGFGGDYILGDSSGADSNIPVTINSLSGITAVEAGTNRACAVNSSSQLQCWGYDLYQYGKSW